MDISKTERQAIFVGIISLVLGIFVLGVMMASGEVYTFLEFTAWLELSGLYCVLSFVIFLVTYVLSLLIVDWEK